MGAKELQQIPGVGKSLSKDLVALGYRQVSELINPATKYIAFRASGRCRNKAQCAGKGHSLAKHWNAGPAPA